ncbi:MAG: GNAT family N-acetyltransferase [Candidatus Sungbacteria bacterium]|nr:GNAT family N-acetyltransferase [Candidatus Sungbacteria bacterium]
MTLLDASSDPSVWQQIGESIRRYGYAPEHNASWYRCNGVEDGPHAPKGARNVVARFPDKSCLLTLEEGKTIYVFSEPVAPLGHRVEALLEYLTHVLGLPGKEKVVLELESGLRKELLHALGQGLAAHAINYTLTWPVVDLGQFDPALPGGRMKHLRHARSKFYREHAVAVRDAREVDKDSLHTLIEAWRKKRGGKDRAYFSQYRAIVTNNFKGTESARALMVDGRVAGLNAGWRIPNSHRYYGAIGLHNYSWPDLGSILYLEDLAWIKEHGYRHADMGGGEKALTKFKSQFGPALCYKTHVFSITTQ